MPQAGGDPDGLPTYEAATLGDAAEAGQRVSLGGQPAVEAAALPLINPQLSMHEREVISEPLLTGVKVGCLLVRCEPLSLWLLGHDGMRMQAVDALTPLARGQCLLLTGPPGSGKSTLALDAALGQRDSDVVCVYASAGLRLPLCAGSLHLPAIACLASHSLICAGIRTARLQLAATCRSMAGLQTPWCWLGRQRLRVPAFCCAARPWRSPSSSGSRASMPCSSWTMWAAWRAALSWRLWQPLRCGLADNLSAGRCLDHLLARTGQDAALGPRRGAGAVCRHDAHRQRGRAAQVLGCRLLPTRTGSATPLQTLCLACRFFSSLLQRCGKASRRTGGGSVSLLAVVPGTPSLGHTQPKVLRCFMTSCWLHRVSTAQASQAQVSSIQGYHSLSPQLKAKLLTTLQQQQGTPVQPAGPGFMPTEVRGLQWPRLLHTTHACLLLEQQLCHADGGGADEHSRRADRPAPHSYAQSGPRLCQQPQPHGVAGVCASHASAWAAHPFAPGTGLPRACRLRLAVPPMLS